MKGPDMGRRLAGLIGVITATLALGLASVMELGHSQTHHAGHHAVAEGKGPTIAGV